MGNKIYELLLLPQTKGNRDLIVNIILGTPAKIDELMDCFFTGDSRLSQNASWSMSVLAEKNPKLLFPFLKKILIKLDEPVHSSVIRNTIRVFQFVDIPDSLEGVVYDKCFSYLIGNDTPVAIRAFSMTVLSNIAMKYPDLKEELIKTIQLYYPSGSAGFKSRAKKELKRLEAI